MATSQIQHAPSGSRPLDGSLSRLAVDGIWTFTTDMDFDTIPATQFIGRMPAGAAVIVIASDATRACIIGADGRIDTVY